MRGRKVDPEFLSSFISECVSKNKISQEEIAKEARSKILEIDSKILEVENLKKIRSKLIDVVFTFDNQKKTLKDEVKILSFFKMQNLHICKFICDSVSENNSKITHFKNNEKYKDDDMMFCIKQLIEYDIISRINDCFMESKEFHNFMKFLVRNK